MASLSEQLRALTNPEPNSFDPENDVFDSTRARLEKTFESSDGDFEASTVSRSVLRKRIEPLLDEQDVKYAGRKVSRARLAAARVTGEDVSTDSNQADSDNRLSSDLEDSEESDGTGQTSGADERGVCRNEAEGLLNRMMEGDTEESYPFGSSEEEGTDESGEIPDQDEVCDDGDVEGTDEDSEEGEGESDDDRSLGEAQDGVSNFSAAKHGEEIEKGKCAKNQLGLWDSLLETRIRFQRALLVTNKLPQHDVLDEFKSDKNVKEAYQQGHKSLTGLLEKLLRLQEMLLAGNPETKHLLYPGIENQKESEGQGDDEEIPSDPEEEEGVVDDNKNGHRASGGMDECLTLPCKRKHEVATSWYGDLIAKRHSSFEGYRNSTISKWSEKTRLASGKINGKTFSSFDKSALTQIQQILSDKDRLIKRTQLKRSAFRVLGKQQSVETSDSEDKADSHLQDYDPEVFDDDDFYHQLLRELIERRTIGNTDDPVEMGRQWLQLQKLRRKFKKKVDTKASKGRKTRYNVHAKLVSFMAPAEKGTMSDSSRNELFCSLFGRKPSEPVCDFPVFR